jgi:hypothetical protein
MNVYRELLGHLDKCVSGKHQLHHTYSVPPSVHRLVDHENQPPAGVDLLDLGQTFAEHFGEVEAVEVVYIIVHHDAVSID